MCPYTIPHLYILSKYGVCKYIDATYMYKFCLNLKAMSLMHK